MLNEKNERMLAYIEKVKSIEPIPGADRIEVVVINGWRVVCGKGEFQPGDLGVFFEIDSKLPDKKPFNEMEFLVSKHFKIKSQKIRGVISQGLFMPFRAFEGIVEIPAELHADCTALLEVTYSAAEDNKRKSSSQGNRYAKMAQYHPNLFKKKPIRWLYKRQWGKKLLFVFFGKKKRDAVAWPMEVSKTDEERIQNQTWRFENNNKETHWVVTEKIDGTSTTFLFRNKGKRKSEFLVCSRNVVFGKDNKKKCFYDTNVYIEMAEKYDIEAKLRTYAIAHNLSWVALQGETYGEGIQRRDYSTKEHKFAGFNLVTPQGRLASTAAKAQMEDVGIPWVPILDTEFVLPDTLDEMVAYADGNSVLDGKPREGVVIRSQDGKDSFKSVSNSFLLKFHQ